MTTRKPIIGPAFDADQTNDAGRAARYAAELRYYRPRGFARLARDLEALARRLDTDKARPDDADALDSAMDAADALLTTWARRVARHDYIAFGVFERSGYAGFYVDADGAREDADAVLEAGDSVPRGFSGMAVFVNDHGNMHAQTYANGRLCRTLFEVV